LPQRHGRSARNPTIGLANRFTSSGNGFGKDDGHLPSHLVWAATMTNLLNAKIADALRRFRDATGGNTVVTFALAFLPLVGLTGAAVDYSRANSIQSEMQAAADSTALMIAQDAGSKPSMNVPTTADSYYRGLFKYKSTDTSSPIGQTLQVTANYTSSSGTVQIGATATYRTMVMGVMGFSTLPLAANSTANFSNSRLRVALVLDNTGSMSASSKLTALKTASTNLLTQLKGAATNNGDVYVSIVTFVRDVMVDPSSNVSASWIDWTDWEAEPPVLNTAVGGTKPSASVWDQTGPGSACPFTTKNQGFGCINTNSSGNVHKSGNYAGLICPGQDNGSQFSQLANQSYNGCYDSHTFSQTGSSASCSGHSNCSCSGSGSSKTCATNSGYYEHTWRPAGNTYATPDHSTWNGCIADRGIAWATSATPGPDTTNNYDITTTGQTVGTASSYYPAHQYSVCDSTSTGLQPMMGLTYNWTSLQNLVNAMNANGSTNQAIGLVNGWQSLVGGGPFGTVPTMDSNYQYQKVIILLTDGLNTQDRWYGDGGSTATQVDDRQRTTCDNIKRAGITIYAIQVDTDNTGTSSLLQGCAGSQVGVGDPSKFFLLKQSNQIVTTFNQIGTQLSKLHIAR
jgi:Flp pilus assembly protein TadG